MTHCLLVLTSGACWLQPTAPGDSPGTLSHVPRGRLISPPSMNVSQGLESPQGLPVTTLPRLRRQRQERCRQGLITLTNSLSQHKRPWNLYLGLGAQACILIFNYNISASYKELEFALPWHLGIPNRIVFCLFWLSFLIRHAPQQGWPYVVITHFMFAWLQQKAAWFNHWPFVSIWDIQREKGLWQETSL